MPPKKKQKTATESSKSSGEGSAGSPPADPTKRNLDSIPEYEYICYFRPHFDFDAENHDRDEPLEGEKVFEEYQTDFDEKSKQNLYPKPAAENPDWKWIMQWKAWTMSQDWKRRGSYCCPDNFGMDLYNDWEGYGLQELIENLLIEFNKHVMKEKDEEASKELWVPISALGYWLNEQQMGAFVNNEDGERVCECYGLIGCAILSALNALDIQGELKSDSKYEDLALVISLFLLWSDGLDSYGIEEDEERAQDGKWYEDVKPTDSEVSDGFDWRKQLVAYAKKAGIDPAKGAYGTAKRIEKYNNDADTKTPWQGRWRWDARWKSYKNRNKPNVGGRKYDITQMTRKERANAAFDGKDPLAGVSAKDLKEGNVMFG